jgi:hypothetical protein
MIALIAATVKPLQMGPPAGLKHYTFLDTNGLLALWKSK